MSGKMKELLPVLLLAALGAGAMLPPSDAAAADAMVVAGTLTCKGDGSIGLIVGSKQQLDCHFQPTAAGHSTAYHGTITKLGVDVGVKGPSTLVWTVLSATSAVSGDALVGTYGGVAADASLGVGVGANALVGGSSHSVALQPISVQGGTGLNIAAGVAEFKLERN